MPEQRDIRVLTLNLWGRHGRWPERRAVLIDGFRTLQPDVAAFQEAINTTDYDEVVDLLGPGFHVVHLTGREPDGTGVSIASRWPVTEFRELNLYVTPRVDPSRQGGRVGVAEIAAPDPVGPLLFVNHKPSGRLDFEHERELQAVGAAQFVEELAARRGAHVVLAGDFDATPDAASVRFWIGRQALHGHSVCYRDAWESTHPTEPGDTFSPRNPLVISGDPKASSAPQPGWPQELGRRIDYILVRCGDHGPTLEISTCRLAFDEPVDGVWASDHFGVVADLVVRRRDQPLT